MALIPTLRTARLALRPFALADAAEVQRLAGDRAVAATTLNIPHPYLDGVAETWIATHQAGFDAGRNLPLAITRAGDGALLGAVALLIEREHDRAELGYWIGRPYWGQGYCTEAAAALVEHGLASLALHRIMARHLASNLASGRVMQKLGMRYEGRLVHHVRKWGVYHDMVVYGLVHPEPANCPMARTQ